MNFFEKQKKPEKESVAAIVPAYNEENRIGNVLKTLTNSKMLDEIIVIDDGSLDNTFNVVKSFKSVKYLRNEKNMGKGYSMEKGVNATKSNIIFFCDADLKGLSPEIVDSIITPVINNEVDMFIGIRNNKMQKSFMPFGINSGERALRREIWEKLPQYYKHRYRIEVGLNCFTKKYGKGFRYKRFDYYQTLKEKKYGFIKGTILRWWMSFDVIMAFLRFNTIDKFKFNKYRLN